MKGKITGAEFWSMISDIYDIDSAVFKAIDERGKACFNKAKARNLDGSEFREDYADAGHLLKMATRRVSDAVALYDMAMNKIAKLERATDGEGKE